MKISRLIITAFIASGLAFVGITNAMARTHHKTTVKAVQPVADQVDLNRADVQTLADLKGIGEKKAEAIVAYRQQHGAFDSIDDLTNVKGIGTKIIARLQKDNPGKIVVNPIK